MLSLFNSSRSATAHLLSFALPAAITVSSRLLSLPARAADGREVGTVKWFDAVKGIGFIMRGDGTEIFVHHSSIVNDQFQVLKDGQLVEFALGRGPKGFVAKHVKSA